MNAKLIIFDCDGVLVDTEAIANDCMAKLFSEFGHPMTGGECRNLFQGKTIEDVCRQVARLANRPYNLSFPDVVRQKVEEALTDGVAPIPGVIDLVHNVIANEMPFCVASSGSIQKMRITLGTVGLLPLMENRLFSAQDVGRGKPHPDVFIEAAKAMNHTCDDAVILEDSVTGVQAGIASGARVLGYAGDPFTNAAALSDAGAEVFHHMSEVKALVGLN